jgi:hypothetical protein
VGRTGSRINESGQTSGKGNHLLVDVEVDVIVFKTVEVGVGAVVVKVLRAVTVVMMGLKAVITTLQVTDDG